MVKSKRSKRVKTYKGSSNGIDRISHLPEALISHILSFLPAKCAVATSILSTRWKFLWTSITNLDIDSDETRFFSKQALKVRRKNFTDFVNRVLLLVNQPCIHNFRLRIYQEHFDTSYLNSWISMAFERTTQELDLILRLKKPFELPLSLIYGNLTVLKLEGDIHFNVPAAASVCFPNLRTLCLYWLRFAIASNSSVSFPNLKSLRLDCVQYANDDSNANDDSVNNLLSSCPVLDDLVIKRDNDDHVRHIIIRIPSLRSLTLDLRSHGYNGVHKLLIDTPALQYLYLDDELPCEYLAVENLSSLLQAKVKLDFNDDYNEGLDVRDCFNIPEFVRCLSNVKRLSVLGFSMKVFETASVNISPGFHNLTWLEIELHCLELSFMISNLLENMDNLEHLVMKGWTWWCGGCSHGSRWTEPLNVPKCLLSKVTSISFSYMIIDCCDELELLRYFLKNAEVLQLMTISTIDHNSKDKQLELLKKISMFPRRSQACQVAFAESPLIRSY